MIERRRQRPLPVFFLFWVKHPGPEVGRGPGRVAYSCTPWTTRQSLKRRPSDRRSTAYTGKTNTHPGSKDIGAGVLPLPRSEQTLRSSSRSPSLLSLPTQKTSVLREAARLHRRSGRQAVRMDKHGNPLFEGRTRDNGPEDGGSPGSLHLGKGTLGPERDRTLHTSRMDWEGAPNFSG